MPTDPRLRVPLAELWPDLGVPGLPVWIRGSGGGDALFLQNFGGDVVCVYPDDVDEGEAICGPHDVFLDLSRPMASDILARRVAMASGGWPNDNVRGGVCFQLFRRTTHKHGDWVCFVVCESPPIGEEGFWAEWNELSHLGSLADLNPADNTRLDWGNLGSPRVVDLVALGIVGRHLFAQSLAPKGDTNE